MLSKKDLLKRCEDLQGQIGNLQDQINVMRSEQITVEVVDSTGKPVIIPTGWQQNYPMSDTQTGYGYYNDKPYPKTAVVNVMKAIEAILERLEVKLQIIEQTPAKAIAVKKE